MSDDIDGVRIAGKAVDKAEALIALGRHEQAIPLLAKALAESPDDDTLHCRLADAYYSLDQYEKSQEHAQRALHLNPGSDHAHFRLAWIHLHINHFDGALKHARAAIKIDPDDAYNLYTLAWCEYHSGHYKQALTAAERALELNPDTADLNALIGDLSFNMNKPKQAVKHYREALRHDPEDAHIHCNLGRALATQHKIHEASDHLLIAVKIEPHNEAYREHLFNIVHHDLMDIPMQNRNAALAKLDLAVKHFYEDQLGRKGWFEKLRVSSVITLWLLALLLLTLFFSWISGEDVSKLSGLVVSLGFIYVVLFVARMIVKYLNLRHQRE
jgi:tetratricopeptide (TPR) repeat protein